MGLSGQYYTGYMNDSSPTRSEENIKAQQKAQEWLKSVATGPLIHWANIVTGGFTFGTNAVTDIHRFTAPGLQSTIVAVLSLGTSEIASYVFNASDELSKVRQDTANMLNAISDELKDPNIEGIPIHAEAESTSQDIEVNKQIVIVQSAANKDVFVDNAVPQLRTWNIKGYLTAVNEGLDPYMIIKPSLLIQRQLLSYYANSRMPVWFKTHDNLFYKALITHIDTAYDVRALNALLVNITLTEYKVLESDVTSLGQIQQMEQEV